MALCASLSRRGETNEHEVVNVTVKIERERQNRSFRFEIRVRDRYVEDPARSVVLYPRVHGVSALEIDVYSAEIARNRRNDAVHIEPDVVAVDVF